MYVSGADPGGGGAPGARPPKIGKNMIFWRKIVMFDTKYPKNVHASLHSAQLLKHSVSMTTNVVSSNPTHGEVYSIQQYVIKFDSNMQQVGGFRGYFGFLHQ